MPGKGAALDEVAERPVYSRSPYGEEQYWLSYSLDWLSYSCITTRGGVDQACCSRGVLATLVGRLEAMPTSRVRDSSAFWRSSTWMSAVDWKRRQRQYQLRCQYLPLPSGVSPAVVSVVTLVVVTILTISVRYSLVGGGAEVAFLVLVFGSQLSSTHPSSLSL